VGGGYNEQQQQQQQQRRRHLLLLIDFDVDVDDVHVDDCGEASSRIVFYYLNLSIGIGGYDMR
jgi:hypothetical protein